MAEKNTISRDMLKQRVVQTITGIFALAGLAAWFLGQWWGVYLAAAAIILFTVATLRWIDDEEVIEKEHVVQAEGKK